MKRVQGIDLLKIIACVLVVGLHTLKPGLGILNRVFSLSGAICMPIFWLSSGFCIGLKEQITLKYVLKKVLRIIVVCFTWELLHATLYFIAKRQFRNFIESFFLDFLQKGLFFHFWFMGSMVVLYALSPCVFYLRKKNCLKPAAAGLLLLNVLLDVLSYLGVTAVLTPETSLRVWNYELYFVLGFLFATNGEAIRHKFARIRRAPLIGAALMTVAVADLWIYFIKTFVSDSRSYADFYISLPVILSAVILFVLFAFTNITLKRVGVAAQWIMGVYILHPFVLAVLEKLYPAFVSGGSLLNLSFWLLTTAICAVAAFVMTKVPLAKELIRL